MNVLIVDDQQSARTMLRHVVEGISPSIRVADFESAVEALRWSESHDVDMLLLDYRMPEMDGLQFTRQFRRSLVRRDVPIVLISIVGDEPLRQAALDAGVIDFLVKPIRPRELRSRLRNLLLQRQQGESLKQRAQALERQLLKGLCEIEEREREILYRLSKAIDIREHGNGQNLMRMARFAGLIAERLGLPDEEVRMLELAAPMHDLGKLGIPDAILLKPGPLTEEERALMRRHPQIGYEILRDSQSRFVKLGAEIALRHHERWDGSGYPEGLCGEAIPRFARIAAVADVYESLLSDRPYRPAWSRDAAVAYLREQSGKLFDPACVEALFQDMTQLQWIEQMPLVRPPHLRD